MKEANHDELEKAEDKCGNNIMIGDTVEHTYKVSASKHHSSYMETDYLVLKSMSHNGTWKGTVEAHGEQN